MALKEQYFFVFGSALSHSFRVLASFECARIQGKAKASVRISVDDAGVVERNTVVCDVTVFGNCTALVVDLAHAVLVLADTLFKFVFPI